MEAMEKIISEVLSYCPWGEVGPRTAHDVAKALAEEGYKKVEEPEKSADEMFAELGYQKTPTRYARSGCAVAFYEKDNGDHQYTIEAVAGAPGGDIGFECRMDGKVCAILGAETKACAQLLREAEESK